MIDHSRAIDNRRLVRRLKPLPPSILEEVIGKRSSRSCAGSPSCSRRDSGAVGSLTAPSLSRHALRAQLAVGSVSTSSACSSGESSYARRISRPSRSQSNPRHARPRTARR